jgi:hypothetical protein
MKDIYIKVKDVPDEYKLRQVVFQWLKFKRSLFTHKYHSLPHEEIDLPALMERAWKAGFSALPGTKKEVERDMAEHIEEILNAPSPLDDYKARSVDFEPTDTP